MLISSHGGHYKASPGDRGAGFRIAENDALRVLRLRGDVDGG